MKACSFLPAATKMIYDMGLEDLLYGVTFECPPEAAGKPAVVRCMLEGNNYSSEEIDRIFSASKAQGKSLYYVEEDLLQAIAPDIIFTQDVCDVCQIDTACTAAAIARLERRPVLIPLTPSSLQDVFQTAVLIATALGREEAAYRHLSILQKKMDHIIDELRRHRAPHRRVMVMEWIEPVYNCGHWIPYQVACAGGIDMLSNPSGDSIVTPWEKIVRYDPEVLVIAPCGFHTGRSAEELHLLQSKQGWQDLQSVRNGAVFLADYDLFTQPSPGTLTDGIELLAALFHPGIFTVPETLRSKYRIVPDKFPQHV
ncbi:ABC transporter substrate-binding protein [Flavitalea sp. BT771]|uniref:ABC transporter substrate-binding protein n=1 Tax=Flavitalea sp. BT771 TaxID=3063329 RepID=UPI0026E463F5|nr:ABC transporter substrate-binding protein [Flavitalea sp. BT771]MDO6434099.1 ABC transporter substrate-binding protein [Flavitalea sp. BT771]MDV6222999.1 ABC transporter substrate-binding protein [Flavitalea sp. BT771]